MTEEERKRKRGEGGRWFEVSVQKKEWMKDGGMKGGNRSRGGKQEGGKNEASELIESN